jgi:hypothetical protein
LPAADDYCQLDAAMLPRRVSRRSLSPLFFDAALRHHYCHATPMPYYFTGAKASASRGARRRRALLPLPTPFH